MELERLAFWRLRQFPVWTAGHLLSELQQQDLHAVRSFPGAQSRKLASKHESCILVDTWQIDLRYEFDDGRLFRVLWAAFYGEGVDPVFVRRVRRSQDRPVPMGHGNVVQVL
ncbi:hypothetical protein KL938_000350 [Ogataea parapolymorpha]|nr:hypothetical protein KL938_000350 [Ogataea parapolymorpha]